VRLPVFADVDTGVDDAFALVYLLASADADLVGIASTGGNVDVDQVCRNNLSLLQLCGATGVPVSCGSPSRSPRRCAAAEVFDAWGRASEANDVVAKQLPIVCALNLTENVVMTPEIMARLAEAAGSTALDVNPLIRVLSDAMRFYFEFHESQGEGYPAHLHDPVAAAVALDPGLIWTRSATVGVELDGTLTRGMTVADWSGFWGRKPNARVGVELDPAVFFERFIERVAPFARRVHS